MSKTPIHLSLLFLCAATGCTSIKPHRHLAGEYDFGPIASKHQSIKGELQQKIAGPILEQSTNTRDDRFFALRPAYAKVDSADAKQQLNELLWPLATSRKNDRAFTWRFLNAMGTNWDVTDSSSRYRFWVLPFWFQGRDVQGENYAALFPIYGHINEFLGRDKVQFSLWPLYTYSTVSDLETHSVLWPIYSKTTGDGVYRHRVFPFYGVSKKEDRFERSFILWPFWNAVNFQTQKGDGSGFCLFPLYAQSQFKDQKIRWFIPPFIRVSQGGDNDRSHIIWPLFQASEGTVNKLYFWPFFGSKTIGHVENTFFAWPIYSHRHLDRSREDVYRTYLLPIYYSHTTVPKPDAQVASDKKVYKKIWPLFSYQKEQGMSRFRFFELWPLKNSPPIERNWAPFWTAYSHHKTQYASETEFLWGMYRRQLRADGTRYTSLFPLIDWSTSKDKEGRVQKSWSLLKGLIGFDHRDDQKSFRFLYFLQFGGTKRDA